MLAEEYFRKGDLEGALEKLKDMIRSQPENSQYRIFFFQLLVINGDWQRALTQLDVLADLDAGTLPMVHLYRQAIACEMLRTEIFAGNRQPTIFGEPPQWMALLLEALKLTAQKQYDQAELMRNQAFEQARESSGKIDGTAFDWIADADARLGPVLEVIVNGQYYWVPFERIQGITIEAPEDLRDFVWLPAHFTWENSGQIYGLIPSRYPGSERSADSFIRLARKTEWEEVAKGVYHGRGQRMLATDQTDSPLLDIRQIKMGFGDTDDNGISKG